MLTPEEYLHVCDIALDGMTAIVTELGDDLACTHPPLDGANTPFAILTHCLGVMHAWAGHRVAGRPLQRDRDAEFRAQGPVADLLAATEQARAQLHADVHACDPRAPLTATTGHRLEAHITTAGAALLHVLEELTQHHGQMQVTRDLLVQAPGRHR
ncbi:DinB family protein [Cellulomonas bogoriensis]|uniref:DinB-like domain-containing protein n=1 Tax=Cellulomonas bogoriensis 69B4 = DSM 16987 TaxID=1386082 RepID=A0A0A0BYH7_9CELL|nr:DinB family protein [Cellulomonas bogoriensis]KGM13458.1 hypothetical protein N869_13830 [Cellulomonas bogoriensis 69B4 = DSM 16987]